MKDEIYFVISFNGKNSYIKINYNPSLDIINKLTLAVWIRVRSFNKTGGIISYGTPGPHKEGHFEAYSLSTTIINYKNVVYFQTN